MTHKQLMTETSQLLNLEMKQRESEDTHGELLPKHAAATSAKSGSVYLESPSTDASSGDK